VGSSPAAPTKLDIFQIQRRLIAALRAAISQDFVQKRFELRSVIATNFKKEKMKKIIYNKLIRDKIPEIIEKSGGTPKIHKLNKTEFKKELAKKILEEGKELYKAKSKADISNELSDLLELIYVIAKENKLSLERLENARIEKNLKRGGFKKQLFLEYVEEK